MKKYAKFAKSVLLELLVYTSGLTGQRLVYFAISDSGISLDSNFAIFIVLSLTSDILRNVLLPVGNYGNTSLNSDVHKSKHQCWIVQASIFIKTRLRSRDKSSKSQKNLNIIPAERDFFFKLKKIAKLEFRIFDCLSS